MITPDTLKSIQCSGPVCMKVQKIGDSYRVAQFVDDTIIMEAFYPDYASASKDFAGIVERLKQKWHV